MTSVGFTGTRKGMTDEQHRRVAQLLVEATASWPNDDFHHGCAVGADTEAAAIAAGLGYRIVEHPDVGDPLGRNREIVAASDVLVAAPRGVREQRRGSGTWATIRYGKAAGIPVTIVYPDGSEDQQSNPDVSDKLRGVTRPEEDSMKKADVEIGGRYHAKVSDRIVVVRITGVDPFGGWSAINEETDRGVRIRSAQRLRSRAAS